jgi:hypothetical protein
MNVDISSDTRVVVQPETEAEKKFVAELFDTYNGNAETPEMMEGFVALLGDDYDLSAWTTLDTAEYPQLDHREIACDYALVIDAQEDGHGS